MGRPVVKSVLVMLLTGAAELGAVAQGLPEIQWVSTGHMWPEIIYQVDISPDSRLLASCSWTTLLPSPGGETILWDLSSLDYVIGSKMPGGYAVRFSPDSTLLAIGGAGVSIRRSSDFIQVEFLSTFNDPVRALAFGSDGQTIAVGAESGSIYLFRVSDGMLLRTLSGHTNVVTSLIFARSGAILLSGSRDGTIRSWNPTSGVQTGIRTNGNIRVNSLAFSPDEKTFVSGHSDGSIRICQTSNLEPITTVTGTNDSITCVDFSPDGTLIAAGGRSVVELRRTSDLTPVDSINIPETLNFVRSVRFDQDGDTLYMAGDDRFLKAWHLVERTATTIAEQNDEISAGAFSRDGDLVAIGSRNGGVQLRERAGKRLRFSLKDSSWSVFAVSFSPVADLLAVGKGNNPVQIWNTASGQLENSLVGHSNAVEAVAFSPDGSFLASGSRDMTVKIWSMPEGTLLRTLAGHSNWVRSVAITPDGSSVASSGDATVRLWRVVDGTLIRVFTPLSCSVSPCTMWSVATSPTGEFVASVSGDTWLWVWRTSDGTVVYNGPAAGTAVAFSPDGKLLATLGFGRCRFVRSGTWSLMREFDREITSSDFIVFSPDGSRFTYGGSSFVLSAVPALRITRIEILDALVNVNWTKFGGPYQLQRISDLNTGTWENVGSATAQTNATDAIRLGGSFYRVVTSD